MVKSRSYIEECGYEAEVTQMDQFHQLLGLMYCGIHVAVTGSRTISFDNVQKQYKEK